MNILTPIILALLTIAPGRYSSHLERHALPPCHRAQQLAEHIEHGAFVAGVPRAVLTALWFHESSLNHKAVSRTGAEGIAQLQPGTPWYRGWLKDCARDPWACEQKNAENGAIALAHYRRECGTMARAIQAYRTGRCGNPGPRTLATMRLAHRISFRMHTPSSAPFVAARLP
jgi:hypothetical protein